MGKKKILLVDYWEKLDPPSRKKLKASFKRYGLSYSKAFRRMNTVGFSQWEYQGIESLLKECGLRLPKERTKFWERLENKENFYNLMATKGMSRQTTHTKFSNFRFASWEKTGIKTILERFERSLIK